MKKVLILVALLCGGVMVTPAQAQKSAPAITRDTDRDGVPDTRDRCRGTAAGTRVETTGAQAGCAATTPPQTAANTPARPTNTPAPSGTPVTQPVTPPVTEPVTTPVQPQATPNQPATTPPQNTARPGTLGQIGVTPPPVVTPDPANTPANTSTPARPNPTPVTQPPVVAPPARPAPAPAVDPSLTAGFWMPAYAGATEAEAFEYARTLAVRTDSAVTALVDVFRSTSGAPMAGATGPSVISSRERRRWERCRLIHFDVRTLADAAAFLKDSVPGGPTLQRAMATLEDAFQGLQATEECDNVVGMVEAPDRWSPWQQNYESSARNFYRDWYTQLRALHAANRAFIGVLNPRLGTRPVPVPGALPPRLGGG